MSEVTLVVNQDHDRHDEEHVIPPGLSYDVLKGLVLNRDPFREQEIREYAESQSPGEQVQHLEKMKTEYVFSRRYEVWDVHFAICRWWVITSPANPRYGSRDHQHPSGRWPHAPARRAPCGRAGLAG
jgi:hypothetical protein